MTPPVSDAVKHAAEQAYLAATTHDMIGIELLYRSIQHDGLPATPADDAARIQRVQTLAAAWIKARGTDAALAAFKKAMGT